MQIISIFKERNAISYELKTDKRFLSYSEHVAVIKHDDGSIKSYPFLFICGEEYENIEEFFDEIKWEKIESFLSFSKLEEYIENNYDEREDDFCGSFERILDVIEKTDISIDDRLVGYLKRIKNTIDVILNKTT